MSTRINVPPLTRGLMVGLFALTLLNAGARYRSYSADSVNGLAGGEGNPRFDDRIFYAPYLTIVPRTSIFYPWVFISATLAEQNPVGLIITGVTLFYGGRYLERAWSSHEYAKFIFLVSFIPNVLSFISYIGLYAITKNMDLITTGISGGVAIQASFLVSFKQLVPEHTVTIMRGMIRVRVKHFPAIFLLANTISGIALGTDTAMLLSWYGFLATWIYLRFYRVSPSLISSATSNATASGAISGPTVRGDASDTFAFACFFPDIAQPAISMVTDPIYKFLVSVKVCTPFSAADIDAGNEQASFRNDSELPSLGYPGRGSGRREEAERRRALALRALDQRLHANSGKGAARPPVPQPPPPQQQQQQSLSPKQPQREPSPVPPASASSEQQPQQSVEQPDAANGIEDEGKANAMQHNSDVQ